MYNVLVFVEKNPQDLDIVLTGPTQACWPQDLYFGQSSALLIHTLYNIWFFSSLLIFMSNVHSQRMHRLYTRKA